MIVYHTSYTTVRYPDVKYSREALDFGKGFYVTRMKKQALDYAEKFRFRGKQAVLNQYELQDTWEIGVKVKHFEAYDEEWLDFVAANRKCLEVEHYDAVEGGIANDKVFRTLDLYFSGDIDKANALKKLKYEVPNHQICLLSQQLINSQLKFITSELL
jgi:hypothetical protein